jgi:AAA+ ATPase superfamily predicted ATPase
MSESFPAIGELFPVGGRLAPAQMIGRAGDVADLVRRMSERQHVVLTGARRIGKTSVCGAACEVLQRDHDFIVVDFEAPEQSSAEGVCQLLIDRTARLDLQRIAQGLLKGAVPFVQGWLQQQGVSMDLSGFRTSVPTATLRAVLSLPLEIARQHQRSVVLFIDELQRAVDYADGVALISGLVDLYAGNTNVAVLVDGSDERTVQQLLGRPHSLGKLAQRIELEPRIPMDQWRSPLRDRFHTAGLEITEERLQRLLDYGAGYPYSTMAACAAVALAARRAELSEVDDFVLDLGLNEAKQRLHDDT